jgi:short-subunit dehydrogenase
MDRSKPKTAVITGATSGLGLECARELVRRYGFHVVLMCRDPARGDQIADRLRRENTDAAVTVLK